MFTIHEALRMPIFKHAILRAGAAGQSNVIRWVHIVDMPDATYAWAKGGELLLTTGLGLHSDPQLQREIIPRLAEKGLAGMVLSIGHYLESAPDAMIEASNRHNFPIIELPSDVHFIQVTEAIFSQIVNRQYALRRRADDIHHKLTELVLDGGTLQDVAEALAGILERSVTIESAAFDVLATAQVGAVDEARKHSVEQGRTSLGVAAQLIELGIYDRLLRERRLLRVSSIPELQMDMERIVAPIIVAREIIGYVWIIAGERHLTDIDELALEHAATVAALVMFKERAVYDTKMMLRGDFLTQLLDISAPQNSELVEKARQLGFRLNVSYQALVVKEQVAAGEGASTLPQRIETWLRDEHPALVVARDMRIVILLHGRRPPDGEQVARRLVKAMKHSAERLLVGVGRGVPDIKVIRASCEQANEAVDVAQMMNRQEGVVLFDELGVLHWLRHLPDHLLQNNIYIEAIHRLADHDAKHSANLLHTLEVYLETGTKLAEAATLLHVHRNTLAYRLERIEEIGNINLRDAACRLNLHVVLKSYRLNPNR